MGESRSANPRPSLLEACRSLSGLAQVELAEIRQRRSLAQKHNDMLDLLGHDYLGVGEVLMNHRLPAGLPLSVVRGYIKRDEDYPQLQIRLQKGSNRLLGLAGNGSQPQSRRQARMGFLSEVSREAGDSHDLRWQVIFNLTLMGALKDADLTADHRRILTRTYFATRAMVDKHLPESSQHLLFRDYPFIQSDGGWSPFEKI